jgi:hypothetical protein
MAFHYSPKIVTDGLVLYLDAANTKSYTGSGTTVNNLSLPETGSLINGVIFDSSDNGYFNFDGTNDKIDLGPRISSLNLTYPFTIDVWVNINATLNTTSPRGIFSTSNTTSIIRYYGISLQLGNIYNGSGNYKVLLNVGNGVSAGTTGRRSFITNDEVIIGNQWCHIVGIINSGPTFKLYINGQEKPGTLSGDGGALVWGVNTITEIGSSNAYNEVLAGKVSNVKFYNSILTPNEILQNYNATKTRYGL